MFKLPPNWSIAPPNFALQLVNFVFVIVVVPRVLYAPGTSTKIAPPLFPEVTFLNSQLSIFKVLFSSFKIIAPPVNSLAKLINLVFLIEV